MWLSMYFFLFLFYSFLVLFDIYITTFAQSDAI